MEQILKSRYRIAEKISENPFSLTYRGFLIGTEKPVVIKIYKRGTLSSSLIKSMKQKVRDFSLITHQGIAKLLDGDYGWQGFYYVREFIEGQSLQELFDRKEKIDLDKASAILGQILEVLEVANARKIVHGALKPANIFIDHQGLVRLTDFVIEGEVKESMPHKVLEMVYNDKYASPEELEGRPLTPASDIFSLGLIFYELVFGKPVLEGMGINCNIGKLKSGVLLPKEALASLPKYASDALTKSLQRDPLLRFSSAREFAESLEHKNVEARTYGNGELVKIFESVVTQYGGEELGKEEETPQEIGKLNWGKEKHRNWVLAWVVLAAVVLGILYAFLLGR